jgi:amino acid adenylation domain-containing protein
MGLLAGFGLVVSRYTGRSDLCLGTTASGRVLPELEGLIGFFINILPLRITVDETTTVADYMALVRSCAIDGFEHQVVPFERIIYSMGGTHGSNANGLVPLVLRHQNFPHTRMDNALPGGVKFTPYSCGNDVRDALSAGSRARCELELSFTGDKDDLKVEVMYASDLFRRETVERLLDHLEQAITSMFEAPNAPLRELRLLTDSELDKLAVKTAKPSASLLPTMHFVERWSNQVRKSPTAVACQDAQGPFSYETIDAHSNRLAFELIERGVSRGDVVGVCLERGAKLLVSLLGIWKAGAAYVPLDPTYPESYLRLILSDASPVLTVGTKECLAKLGQPASQELCLDENLKWSTDVANVMPPIERALVDLAYIMYTSGSTGVPKGVRVPHRQLVNWLGGIEANYPFEAGEVIAQKTTMAFAVSVKEIFAGLLNGCKLVFIDAVTVQDTIAFVNALEQFQITRLNLVPSHLDTVIAHLKSSGRSLKSLKWCITAGEPLTAELVMAFRTAQPNTQLINNYGCTELNDITYYDVAKFDATQGFVPIGMPIQNSNVYVLDRCGRLVPDGVAGELHVASDSMAYGYHNLPALTRERFQANRFSEDSASVLYNTGDVVKRLADGNLEFLGRWDFQVKIRGFRVDVRHVEKILGEFPGIGARAVVGDGDRLCGYYVEQAGHSVDIAQLREFLGARLPPYMVPSVFVVVQAMPRLPNGKLDRRALRPSSGRLQQHDSYEAPRAGLETNLAGIWSSVLEVPEEDIGRHTHFFEIGGHSLSATRVMARIKEGLNLEVGLSTVFEYPRLSELAAFLSRIDRTDFNEDELANIPGTVSRSGGSSTRGASGLLDGKVVLVTGASRGIGSAAVRLLASQGAQIALNYMHSKERASAVKDLIERDGGVAEIFQADVTSVEQVNELVKQVRQRFGRIDVLVANAAIGFKIQPFIKYTWNDFERKITDELRQMFYLCQAVVPDMQAQKSGSIIAVSSSMSKLAEKGYVAHSSAKAALDAFVRALAIELGPDGIRINTVAPGLTLTDATVNLPHQQKDAAASRCPLRRNGAPRDVAGAILFYASDLSQFMTGTYLPVDGGFTML